MTCQVRIERDGVSLTFEGPEELGAAVATLVARYVSGEALEGPVPTSGGAVPASPDSSARRRGMTSTERSQARRARLAEEAQRARATDATANATDATLHATAHATGVSALASASLSSPSSSPSLAFSPSLGESPSARARGDATAVATGNATDATAAAVALPDWARMTVETVRMTLGEFPAAFDALETWVAFTGHCAKVNEKPEAGGWQAWLARQRSFDRSRGQRGGRVVQRDPPGPKAYRVASDDDEWTTTKKEIA